MEQLLRQSKNEEPEKDTQWMDDGGFISVGELSAQTSIDDALSGKVSGKLITID